MNLNPFVFPYKYYPDSKLATAVNCICSFTQRIILYFTIILSILFLFDEENRNGGLFITIVIMLFIWYLLKSNKDKWSEKIATKQANIDK